MPHDALSYERIQLARETLTEAAFLDGFLGALQAVDVRGVLIEARRNLGALIHHLHGEEAFARMLEEE
jgi:hypothetical protein